MAIFIERLGKASSGTFFSKASACWNYTFGPRSLNALAPFSSFSNMHPLWQLGQSLAQRGVGEYGHAVRALGPLAPIVVSLRIVLVLQAFHLSISPSLAFILCGGLLAKQKPRVILGF